VKLPDWAKQNGLDYKTAYRFYRSERFPRLVERQHACVWLGNSRRWVLD